MARKTQLKLLFSVAFGGAALLASLGAGFGNDGENDRTKRTSDIQVENCFVEIINDVDVPAHVAGPLKKILVKEGMTVKIDDVLAIIDDQMAQRRAELAMAKWTAANRRASDTIEIQYSQAAYEVANKEWEISYNLRKKGAVSASEYEKTKFERRKSELQIQRSKNEREIAEIDALALEVEHKTAVDNVERHKMNSPVIGIVKAVHKNAQEWVEIGEPVLQVVRLDRVRVKGWINSTQYDVHEIHGRPVTVTYNAKNGTEIRFEGKIDFVDLQTRGDKYMVWAEVDNQLMGEHWLLLAGAPVKMQIHLGPPERMSRSSGDTTPIKNGTAKTSANPNSPNPNSPNRIPSITIPEIKSQDSGTSGDADIESNNVRPNLRPSTFEPIKPQPLQIGKPKDSKKGFELQPPPKSSSPPGSFKLPSQG